MREFRAALAMYLYVALMAYTAILGVNWALALDPQPRPLIAILRAVDPGHSYLDAQGFGAHFALLGALDVLSFLAMAATPFLAYAAVARRAAAPHPALMRALASALAPVRAWALACDAAADRMAAGAAARDAHYRRPPCGNPAHAACDGAAPRRSGALAKNGGSAGKASRRRPVRPRAQQRAVHPCKMGPVHAVRAPDMARLPALPLGSSLP